VNARVTVSFTQDTYECLQDVAEKEDVSIGKVVRDAVDVFLGSKPRHQRIINNARGRKG